MAKTEVTGSEVKLDSLKGEDIYEESLLCEKIPFSHPQFLSQNVKDAVVEAKGVWGSNFSHTTKTTTQNTTQTTLQDYHTATLNNLTVGAKYRVGLDFNSRGDNSASGYYVAVSRDTTVLRQVYKVPPNQRQTAEMSDSLFTYFIATATSHTIKVQFSSQYTWAQATMLQCGLEVWRVQ